jgi:hypothetical protein
MTIRISPRAIARSFLLVVLLIATLGVAAEWVRLRTESWSHRGVAVLAGKFVLDSEQSLPAWFSSLALAAAAATLALIACSKRRARSAFASHWTALAVIFVLLSLDEMAAFHEMFIPPLQRFFGASGIFYYAWVIPAMVFVASMGLAYRRFVFDHLDRATRRRLLIAAAIYLVGAIGLELIEGPIDLQFGRNSLAGEAALTIEETLEMFGVVYFLYALLVYASEQIGTIHLSIVSTASARRGSAGSKSSAAGQVFHSYEGRSAAAVNFEPPEPIHT